MTKLTSDLLIGTQIAQELSLIGRYHNVRTILTAWLESHDLYLLSDGIGYHVIRSIEGIEESLGRVNIYEQALAIALGQIDADIAALKLVQP